jgi:AraC-like DNA-binding protein
MKSHIGHAIEIFFYSTHMPIKAFGSDGALINSFGYDSLLETKYDSNEIYRLVERKILEKESSLYVNVTYNDNIKFIGLTICPCNAREGFFVIGPYLSEKIDGSNIIYKPESCIPYIVSLLQSLQRDINVAKDKSISDREPYSFYINKALDYINKNYHEPISLDYISKVLDINKCYFCSLFKNETGKTYSQYLNELRIEKSKELIKKENLSLLDVALAVGFNNQNYFNMIFKKLSNMTPLEFKNSQH